MRSDVELLQSAVVISVYPIKALTKREVRFCQIWLQPQSNLCFSARFLFPAVEGLVKMKNLRAYRSEPCVGQCKIRIERDRLQVKLLCSFVILPQRVEIACSLIYHPIQHGLLHVSL